MTPLHPPTFAALLRRHRLASGLSQEALAEKTGLSVDAIGLLERGERQHPRWHTLQVLAAALAVSDEDRGGFLAAARSPAGGAGHKAIDSLPHQASPILGRASEVDGAMALLRGTTRLLTLTGPGGVGKSRLAYEVTERIAGSFAEGVTVVPLASLADPSLVVSAIAAALGVREVSGNTLQRSLEEALAGRDMLLVLDNFEQPPISLQGGADDLHKEWGNWPLANQEMAAALAFAGYEHQFAPRHGKS